MKYSANSYGGAAPADIPSEKIEHIYPQFGREHITDQRGKCWCQPEIMLLPYSGGALIIHEAEQ